MRNKSLSIGVLIWISLIWISLSAAQGETWPPPICSERSKDNPEPRTRLAVLYQQELEESYLKGVKKALDELEEDVKPSVCRDSYSGDEDGVGKLVDIIQEKRAEVILGPTFSGVYLGAIKQLGGPEECQRLQVPVISPVVQAPDVRNDRNGWFFRTNVDARRRVEAMIAHIEGFPIGSLAVLYPNTGFGRLAEEHFRRNLPDKLLPHYRAHEYKRDFSNLREVLSTLLDRRPEALGIFGVPSEIIRVVGSIQRRGRYRPFLFTIIDPSLKKKTKELDELHYVSVAECLAWEPDKKAEVPKSDDQRNLKGSDGGRPQEQNSQICREIGPNRAEDEIEALTFDTARLLLEGMRDYQTFKSWKPVAFRDWFAGQLQSRSNAGKLTSMSLSNLENQAAPYVYAIKKGEIELPESATDMNAAMLAGVKLNLVRGRFGDWPLWRNIGLLIVVTIVVASLDLKRSFEGQFRKIYGYTYFWLLCLINVGVVLALYFVLAEREAIRYDSWAAALIVAMGPSVFLRTTFFETPTGKAIGLANLYDRFLLWISEKMMIRRYSLFSHLANVIAYYNPRKSLEDKLHQLYQNAKTQELRRKLEKDLGDELQGTDSYLEQRLICARRLLRRFDWKELREEFAPRAFRIDHPGDPATLVRRCALYCQQATERQDKLKELVEARFTNRPKDLKAKFEEEIEQESPSSYEFLRVRFLVTRCSFIPSMLKEAGLLAEGFELPRPDMRSYLRRRWDRFVGSSEESQSGEKKADPKPTGKAAGAA